MRKSKFKKIEPGSGLGQIQFGLSMEEVVKIIGEPNKKYKETFQDSKLVEVWDYDELGLSLKFDGSEVLELNSMSIISSFFEYNGNSIIGRTFESVSKILKGEKFHKIYHNDVPEKTLLYAPDLNLIVWFEYDVATSLSWDTSDVELYLGKKYTKKQSKEVKKKISAYRKARNESKRLEEERNRKNGIISYTEIEPLIQLEELDIPIFFANVVNVVLILIFGAFAMTGLPMLFGSITIFLMVLFFYFNYKHIKENPKN